MIVLAFRRAGGQVDRPAGRRRAVAAVVPVGLLGVVVERSLNPCERETAYYCARVLPDLSRASAD